MPKSFNFNYIYSRPFIKFITLNKANKIKIFMIDLRNTFGVRLDKVPIRLKSGKFFFRIN